MRVATYLLIWSVQAGPVGLQWRDTAVHPGCIRELQTALADPRPIVAAVDLEGCRRSNKYSDKYETDGRILRWTDPADKGRGYFQYEYLGALANGVHVVRTGESGGGSGFLQALMFLRVMPSAVLEDGRSRAREMLTLAGSETLGDRNRVTVTLSGDTVTIVRREFRGANDYGPPVTIVRRVR